MLRQVKPGAVALHEPSEPPGSTYEKWNSIFISFGKTTHLPHTDEEKKGGGGNFWGFIYACRGGNTALKIRWKMLQSQPLNTPGSITITVTDAGGHLHADDSWDKNRRWRKGEVRGKWLCSGTSSERVTANHNSESRHTRKTWQDISATLCDLVWLHWETGVNWLKGNVV